MKVWENSKKLWKHSPAALVPTTFLVLPNFHSCFYKLIINGTGFLFHTCYTKLITVKPLLTKRSPSGNSLIDVFLNRTECKIDP